MGNGKVEEVLRDFIGTSVDVDEILELYMEVTDEGKTQDQLIGLLVSFLERLGHPIDEVEEHRELVAHSSKVSYTLGYLRGKYELERKFIR